MSSSPSSPPGIQVSPTMKSVVFGDTNFKVLTVVSHRQLFSVSGGRLRPIDLILRHLTIANSLVILSKGVTQTIESLGVKDFLDDTGCKLFLCLYKVSRGVSTGCICLLSVFQMITLRSWTSRWAELKERAPKYLNSSLILNWMLNLLVNLRITLNLTGVSSNKNITRQRELGYCFVYIQHELSPHVITISLSFPDLLSLSITVWASGSIISMLYRHKHQVQHLHRNRVTPRESPETRATHTILVLLSTFLSLYALSSIFQVYLGLSPNPSWVMVKVSALLAACFPIVCPFVLMRHHHHSAFWLCCDQRQNTHPFPIAMKL
ncbi:vomeronasal type-1 receptor 4-like [Suncus etruscus]|uniref:vomeronasal type-1 receptor 4-like n=1 Tax=Suncus etruscus TaxID=109475 RepID=UPI00210FDEBB|nr:vomeronasal type-1 receptor 4-like [Suncus etruscus]